LNEALGKSGQRGEHWYEGELHRLLGEVLLKMDRREHHPRSPPIATSGTKTAAPLIIKAASPSGYFSNVIGQAIDLAVDPAQVHEH
jgi:hypothetical protein